jgi:ascorbate PTS system EIIC component
VQEEHIMGTIASVLSIVLEILKTPALLVGVITMLGLVLQKSPPTEIVKSTIKAALGFVVLGAGATILIGALDSFGKMFQAAFELRGVVPNNEAVVSIALKSLGETTALIMLFGMVANVFIARLTPLKFIFLSGHHVLFMAALLSAILYSVHASPIMTVAVGSVTLGFVMAFFPWLAQWAMRRVIGSDDFAMGHFGTTGYVLSAVIGKLVGGKSKSTEEMEFPKSLLFFRESMVAIASTMLVLYLIVAAVLWYKLGADYLPKEISSGQNTVVFCILQSLTFAAGIYVVLAGVRLIVGEIVPAFKGISDRLVPDAKPALDCAVVFPFAPNAVIVGFLFSFLGGLAALGICGWARWTLILPGVIPHFFCGGTAGVFGNATGGRRGCVVGAFAHGILITFLPLLLLPVLGELGYANTTFGDADFGVVGSVFGRIAHLFSNP